MAHSSLCGHRKLGRLVRALKITPAEAIGTLEFLWWAAAEERVGASGALEGWSIEDVAYRCQWRGDPVELLKGLGDAGFIDKNSDGLLSIHDWKDWAPEYVKKRWERNGWKRPTTAADGKTTADNGPKPNLTQPKATKGNTPPTPPRGKRDFWEEAKRAMGGDCLNVVDFTAAWLDWIDERQRAGRKAYTPRGVTGQIHKLEKLGHDRAIAAIRHSITEGYVGIYERSRDGQRQGARPAPRKRTPADRGEYDQPGFGDD